jgi:hypothetical protein
MLRGAGASALGPVSVEVQVELVSLSFKGDGDLNAGVTGC